MYEMQDQEGEQDHDAIRKNYEASKPKYPETTFKKFLEETPPDTYVTLTDLKLSSDGRSFTTPELVLFCESEICNGLRVFHCGSVIYRSESWRYDFLTYVCRNCSARKSIFAVASLQKSMPTVGKDGTAISLKLGQMPAFGPQTAARLMMLVGPDREIFLQGRRAENRGMGIGAFAYYRRVVENQKNRIIAEIAKVSKVLGSTPEIDALFAAAMKETRFSESIDMVKGAIPQTLLISGRNPLTLLHSALSKGLHDAEMTDAHCLALAQSIRTILGELAERASEALKNNKEIQNALSLLMSVPNSEKSATTKTLSSPEEGKPKS
jgi:hypothetical protein